MRVEIALPLKKSLDYYLKKIEEVNGINFFICETHDVYYTDKDLNGMSEEEMKNSCVRFRYVEAIGGIRYNENETRKSWIENYHVYDEKHENRFFCELENFRVYEEELLKNGFKKVFDTKKKDYQFRIGDMKSMIQLQVIDDVGLVLYYDNPDYYNLDKNIQRDKLIEEIETYGIDSFENKDIDKLRSLYYKKIIYNEDTV